MNNEKTFGQLSDFKNKSVSLYRSSDQFNTKLFFTNPKEEIEKPYFEVLHFHYDNKIFIKSPNTKHFVELYSKSSHTFNNMTKITKIHVSENLDLDDVFYIKHNFELKDVEIKFFIHDNNMMLLINDENFNFLKLIATYDKDKDKFIQNELSLNINEIENVLNQEYIKLPEYVRCISYTVKTTDFIPTYYIIDYPKYNFSYDNQRLHKIENNIITECKITSFLRYKDGGTTEVEFIDNDKTNKFYLPFNFSSNKVKHMTLNDKIIINATEEDISKIRNILKI